MDESSDMVLIPLSSGRSMVQEAEQDSLELIKTCFTWIRQNKKEYIKIIDIVMGEVLECRPNI